LNEPIGNQLAALHDSLNVQSQYEIAALKKQMADDPQAVQKLGQSTKDWVSPEEEVSQVVAVVHMEGEVVIKKWTGE